MSGEPERFAVAQRWLRWAEEDLALARSAAGDRTVVPRGACVWAHQAAEKAIKSLLVLRDVDPPKLHDLDRLSQRLPDGDSVILSSLPLTILTTWAIEGRYPIEANEATLADALEAIDLAGQVIDIASARIERD